MGFVQPSPPPFDLEEWRSQPYLTRLRMNCQDWAVNGFAPPDAVYLLYAIKLVLYLFLAALVITMTTPGVGGLGDIGDWWHEPIVFQKFVVWTAIWEIIGLGSGSMQLAARYGPVIGGAVYWLRPGTVPPAPSPGPAGAGWGCRRGRTRSRCPAAAAEPCPTSSCMRASSSPASTRSSR